MTQHHVVASPPQASTTDQQRFGDRFQRLQALEDALKFRRARAAAACDDCAAAAAGRCDDHGRDLDLIGEYERAARRLCAELDAITGLIAGVASSRRSGERQEAGS